MPVFRPYSVSTGIEVFPTRTPTLPPATHTNSYAIGSQDIVLIEPATPWLDEQREWLEWARGIQSQGRVLQAILLTHHHADHCGGAAFFAQELRVPLWAHEQTFLRVSSLEPYVKKYLIEGEHITLHGPISQSWNVLHTPGHAPGHLCLYERSQRTAIVGDMVANGSFILIPPNDGGDMAEYIKQLQRLNTLELDCLLPAHGQPIYEAHDTLHRYVEHRLAREQKIFDAYRSLKAQLKRAPRFDELLPHAYEDTPIELWPVAQMSLEAHCIKLKQEGFIES